MTWESLLFKFWFIPLIAVEEMEINDEEEEEPAEEDVPEEEAED